MRIENLRVNHVVNPVGYEIGTPVFSFVPAEAEGTWLQTARIQVAKDTGFEEIVADTGDRAELNPLGEAVEMELLPRTRYFWRVLAKSDAGDEGVSSTAYFETGKMDEPWASKWITVENEERDRSNPTFRTSFDVNGVVLEARLYISGLGIFEAAINGKRVGDEFLTPYCTDYIHTVQYITYDVKDLLNTAGDGANEISVELGDGWYKGRFGFEYKGDKGFYGDSRKLIAELRIRYADGTEKIVGTDETWTVSRGKVLYSNIYDGEHRDDRTGANPEKLLLLPEEECAKLPLAARLSLPVKAHGEIKPVELIDTPAGEKVFDLGQNFAGIFRLHVHGVPAGETVRVQTGEVLQGGNFYNDNLRSAKSEYIYISDGEDKVIEPKFTFYGYRYAKVSGMDEVITIDDFTGIPLYSDIPTVGKLTTGDAKLNQLISNIQWGQRGNFIDVPTDCPQRDERMGWTADTQVFVPTACYFTDPVAFYHKFLKDMRTEQSVRDGLVPNVIPAFGMPGTSSVWGDAATLIPWALYLWYGDVHILEDCFWSMKSWVDYITRTDGDNHQWRREFHFGDWLALDHPKNTKDQVKGGTEDAYIADIYYMYSAQLVSKAAALIGKADDAAKYAVLAGQIRSEIRREYFTATGRTTANTQTGYLLALNYDLSDDPERIYADLIQLLTYKDYKLTTGFVGTPYLMPTLTAHGDYRLAYDLMHNEEYPGWLYEVNLGATTVWERWNSMEADGSVSSTGMNSFNHYAYGSVGQWMWQTMGGIAPVESEPGFKRASIRPVPDYRTGFVRAEYASASGTWRTSWEVTDETHAKLTLTVPFNCSAEVVLPWAKNEEDKERTLTAGEYEWVIESADPFHTVLTVDDTLDTLLNHPQAKKVMLNYLPQIDQAPPEMRKRSFRELVQEGYDVQLLAKVPLIDAELRAL